MTTKKLIYTIYKELEKDEICNDLQIFISHDKLTIWKGVGSVNKKLLHDKEYKDTELKEALEECLKLLLDRRP
jgi:hypothetical protein